MRVLAIDPGNIESAFVLFDDPRQQLRRFGKVPNAELLEYVKRRAVDGHEADALVVEKIAMGGMIAGQETFDTAMWVGRYVQAWDQSGEPPTAALLKRMEEKMHLCRDSRAKDKNIRQALLDRFGPGTAVACGTKAKPGPLYGVSGDVWAALAVAVTWADRRDGSWASSRHGQERLRA